MKTLDEDFPVMASHVDTENLGTVRPGMIIPAIQPKKSSISGLDLLREPFPAHQISKLPKPTKRQTDEVKANFKAGVRCTICGAWHHPDVIHLDYVGHAALTDRLLDADSAWYWEPLAINNGLPVMDSQGGMWIKLTVCGVTRLGYGHAGDKSGGDAIKEIIGDALRNAAMRFGAALDLWHKGDLHIEEDTYEEKKGSKSVAGEEWDKLDQETKDWMVNEAMAVAVLIADGDIVGAYQHIESLGMDGDYKTAFWSRLDPTQRSSIKACASILHSKDQAQLIKAWGSVPKHAQAGLMALKDKRKAELGAA